MSTWRVDHGDCLDLLRAMPDASVDAVVTDPPYGLSFMGKKWDYDVPSVEVWAECLRVLKPGGHLLAFAGTRTQHRMAVRIEDAGFEIRDMIAWVYGSGFPKSLDVGKAMDKAAGAVREVIGSYTVSNDIRGGNLKKGSATPLDRDITAPATDLARQWQGWGTALKPALEPITMARKPFPGVTVAANVAEWGTGAVNVDGCRVGTTVETWPASRSFAPGISSGYTNGLAKGNTQQTGAVPAGRWPSNLIHDGSEEVLAGFPVTKSGGGDRRGKRSIFGGEGDSDTERAFEANSGSAARFFYCPKASKADRDSGCEGLEEATSRNYRTGNIHNGHGGRVPDKISRNPHPTVKPTALMQYLCRLVTPPGGTVLDPFCVSGSTGKAAMLEGFNFVGMEREAEYVEIARRRIAEAAARPMLEACK